MVTLACITKFWAFELAAQLNKQGLLNGFDTEVFARVISNIEVFNVLLLVEKRKKFTAQYSDEKNLIRSSEMIFANAALKHSPIKSG
jgi:hypothetical protein